MTEIFSHWYKRDTPEKTTEIAEALLNSIKRRFPNLNARLGIGPIGGTSVAYIIPTFCGLNEITLSETIYGSVEEQRGQINAQVRTTNRLFIDYISKGLKHALKNFRMEEQGNPDSSYITNKEIEAMKQRMFPVELADRTISEIIRSAQSKDFRNTAIYGISNPDYGLCLQLSVNQIASKGRLPIAASYVPQFRKLEVKRTD
jgi:hypothetical protein